MQANYFRGMALRKQLRYAEAARHLDRALDAAQKAGDGIQDEIWREVAACSFSWWQQASQVRCSCGRADLHVFCRHVSNIWVHVCPVSGEHRLRKCNQCVPQRQVFCSQNALPGDMLEGYA